MLHAISNAFPPGYELHYKAFTSDASISSTTEGTPSTIVTADPVYFDGSTEVWIFFSSQCVRTAAGVDSQIVVVGIYEDGTAIGRIGQVRAGTVAAAEAVGAAMNNGVRRTPAAGWRTFSAEGWVTIAGTAIAQAGTGGVTASVPGYIRIVKA